MPLGVTWEGGGVKCVCVQQTLVAWGPQALLGDDSTPSLSLCALMPSDTAVGFTFPIQPSLLSMENSLMYD